MNQIQHPRFIIPLLVSAEISEPDLCHKIGQTLLSPWAIGLGYCYRIDGRGVHALPSASLARRVAVVAIAILLWPLTLTATVLGGWISSLSTTQKRAYTQIKNWNIGVVAQNERPEITSNQLILRPIKLEDLPAYEALFNQSQEMGYGINDPFNVREQFHDWLNQWEEHPYSALAVVDRQSGLVIGHAMLGAGDFEREDGGWADLSILIDPAYRNDAFDEDRAIQGRDHIGSMVARMLVTYGRFLQEKGYLVPAIVHENQAAPSVNVHYDAAGLVDWAYVPLSSIRADVHRDDIASRRIGERLIREVGARTFSPSVDRERFVLQL